MKHQYFTRSLFVAFCAFFVCASAMAGELNPFAFKLSKTFKSDTLVVTYYLNAPATNVDIIVDLGNDKKFTENCNDKLSTQKQTLKKGIYVVDIPLRPHLNDATMGVLLRNKNSLQWSIKVTGGNTAEYRTCGQNGGNFTTLNTSIAKSVNFYNAGSVDVNIDPYSETFGDVYVVERRANAATTEEYFSTINKTSVSGVYVFDAAFQHMPVKRSETLYTFENGFVPKNADDQKAFTFNLNSTSYATHLKAHSLDNMLMQVRLVYDTIEESENVKAHLFASAQTTKGPIFMHGDTEKMDYYGSTSGWSEYVIGGQLEARNNTTEHWLMKNDKFIAAPNIIFDIKDGKDGKRRVLMVSGWPDGNNSRTAYRCDEYDLTETEYGGKDGTYTGKIYPTPSITGIFKQNVAHTDYENCWHIDNWSLNRTGTGKSIEQPFITSADVFGVEYDEDGRGFWICQGRDNHSGMPSLTHFRKVGSKYEVNFIEYWAERGKDAVRYNNTYDKLIVSGGKYQKIEKDAVRVNAASPYHSDSKVFVQKLVPNTDHKYYHPAATVGYATIFTINKDELNTQFIDNLANEQKYAGAQCNSADRKSLFVDSVYLDLDPEGKDPTTKAYDFAWDYADNLYVAMGAWHQVAVYPLPNGGAPVSTPCRKSQYFNTPVANLNITIDPLNTGEVVDHEYDQSFTYYMPGAWYTLRAKPYDGYRFYCWDEYDIPYPQTIGATKTSPAKFPENGKERTAHFGIDVWETKAITQTDKTMTFRGVFVQRELDTKSYSTICLPFNLTTLEGTPYEGASVLKFDEAEDSDVAGDNRTFLTFKEVTFTNGDIMEAGKPYLIKVNTPIAKGEEKIFNNVTCPPIGSEGGYVTKGNVTFHGLLNPTTFTKEKVKDKLFLTADNRLVSLYGQDSFTINGLRGYFTVKEGAKNVEYMLNLPEKVTTSIPMVNIADSLKVTKYLWNGQIYIQRGNEVYDLSGARVK